MSGSDCLSNTVFCSLGASDDLWQRVRVEVPGDLAELVVRWISLSSLLYSNFPTYSQAFKMTEKQSNYYVSSST